MARDILNEYGPDHRAPVLGPGSSGLTSGGGKPSVKSSNYADPCGPVNMNNEGPGLRGGVNTGNSNVTTGHDDDTGSPGLHGNNHGNKGSQGSY